MSQITTTQFYRRFAEFRRRAQHEPVQISRHGRRELVLMSADHYDWFVAAARRTSRTVDAPSVVVDAVRQAVMSVTHAKFDRLMM